MKNPQRKMSKRYEVKTPKEEGKADFGALVRLGEREVTFGKTFGLFREYE